MTGWFMPRWGTPTLAAYSLVCGVPGHGLGGQYVGFVVSAIAKAASFK